MSADRPMYQDAYRLIAAFDRVALSASPEGH